MSFLTVEDINSVNLNHINEFHIIDTSKISEQEFDSVLYDFCIVSHEINGNNHIFTFEIHNSLWTGAYYFTKKDGTYLDFSADYTTNKLEFTTSESSVCLNLYLCSFRTSFFVDRRTNIVHDENIFVVSKNELNSSKYLEYINLRDNSTYKKEIILREGVFEVELMFFLVLLKKSDLIFNLKDSATVGIVNSIKLNVDDRFLPQFTGIFQAFGRGTLVNEDLLDITVICNGLEIPVVYDENIGDYYFDLDLTDKIDDNPVKFDLIVNEIDLVNASVHNLSLSCNYPSASNFEELKSNIVSGAKIIELTNDIVFNSNLIIPNNLLIYSKNHNVYLSSHNIRVPENVSVEIDDANFFNGANCFIQEINSKLILKNCRFENAIISDNYKGSVISADYDGSENSIGTELINCRFINCHHTIYHGGDLTIKNCKALFNNFNDGVDTDYPAFLTAYDGTVEITNSIFDIDYDTDYLADNNIDIKFAEALIGLGEDTFFNGYATNQLKYNDSLPFFEYPYNNKSHIFAKYYYPQIDASVISSPILSKEDNCLCHIIIGTDWVYKNNVQITRTSWESENNNRKIQWEDD